MRYRELGSTGIAVSEIGFGAWGIGGDKNGAVAYGPTEEAESLDAVLSAVEAGITFFDTADLYGFGHSEQVLGRALSGRRADVVLASKVGMIDASGRQDFSPAHMRGALEASLRRLQTERLDLYQLHSPSIELLRSRVEIVRTLEELKREGRIRACGISLQSPDDGKAAVEEFGFECVQVNFNLLDQRALDNGLLELCARRRVGVIVRTPLVFGFLTGRYSPSDDFSPADHRRRWSPDQLEKWATAHERFAPLVASDGNQTPSQFALRFCLSFPGVSTVIPGMLKREHVVENAAASALGGLDRKVRDRATGIYRESRFFVGKQT